MRKELFAWYTGKEGTVYIHRDGTVTLVIRGRSSKVVLLRKTYKSESLAMKAWQRWTA